MSKKQLTVIDSPDPKFLFINDTGEYATIYTMSGVMSGGTPIVPDGYEDEGEDCSLICRVEDDSPEGEVNQNEYELPPEAKQEIENVREHRDEFSYPENDGDE